MNVSDVLSREFFRPFATIVVPGAVAILPYVFVFNHWIPIIEETWQESSVSFSLGFFVFTIAMGLILEDLGAKIELTWDKKLNKKAPNEYHFYTWYKYLELKYEATKEPIGQHYLRTVLLRMKFELSFGLALILCVIGFIWLYYLKDCILITDCLPWYEITLSALIPIVVSIWLLRESYLGAEVLGEIRSMLVHGKTPEKAEEEGWTKKKAEEEERTNK